MGSFDKAWSSTLAHVTVKSELGDGQHGPADVGRGQVHLSFRVLEDSESGDLAGQSVNVPILVLTPDSDQDNQPTANSADLLRSD